MKVVSLLACHNRKEKTLRCLSALRETYAAAGLQFVAVLTDDGSTDGTAAAVMTQFPEVSVIQGNGELYWCRGMHAAWVEALRMNADAYLWINDDIVPTADAALRLLATMNEGTLAGAPPPIVVGSMRWPGTQSVAYGGVVKPSRFAPTRFRIIPPEADTRDVDTMNGNLVLVPHDVVEKIGILDPAFEHGMGDYDYGLRATRTGIRVLVAPGFFGECSRNPPDGSFLDRKLTRFARLKKMLGRRGLPPGGWWHFTRRHAGPFWPFIFAWPYLRTLIR